MHLPIMCVSSFLQQDSISVKSLNKIHVSLLFANILLVCTHDKIVHTSKKEENYPAEVCVILPVRTDV